MLLGDKQSMLKKAFLGLFITTFAGNLYSMVFGYIGSAGLPFITSILLLVYAGGLDTFDWKNNVFIGDIYDNSIIS